MKTYSIFILMTYIPFSVVGNKTHRLNRAYVAETGAIHFVVA